MESACSLQVCHDILFKYLVVTAKDIEKFRNTQGCMEDERSVSVALPKSTKNTTLAIYINKLKHKNNIKNELNIIVTINI